MTELATAVDADDKLWVVDTMPDAPFLQVESELVEIRGRVPEHIYPPTQELLPPKIRVRRAAAGTAAASHVQGTTLTAVYPESPSSPGGGGVTVDNTVDAPEEGVTTFIAPGAVLTSGQADLSALAGVQIINLLGPFPVTYQSSGIATAAGTLLTTLDAGVLLLKPMLMTTAYFEVDGGANPTSIGLQIAVGATNVALINYDPENQQASSIAEIEGNFDVGGVTHLNVLASACFTTQATQLRLRVTGTLVAGAGDVYALIATPA